MAEDKINLRYYIGCSDWKNRYWNATFYPQNLDHAKYLSYYSENFNFVHLDFTERPFLYGPNVLNRWDNETPDDFRFTIKIPPSIISAYSDAKTNVLSKFLKDLSPLKKKILAIVFSPPKNQSFNKDGREWLDNILKICTYYGFSPILDFNNCFSWYQDLVYNTLRKHKSAFVWYDAKYKFYYPAITSNFLFLKLMRKNMDDKEQKQWLDLIKQKEADNVIDFSVIVVNDPTKALSIQNKTDMPVNSFRSASISQPRQIKQPQEEQKQTIKSWTGRVVIHVDMNAFFPACEELRNPSLKGMAHAVIMTPEKGSITRGAVASCSYQARRYGVRSAMSLLKAKELCPDLILNPVDKAYYNHISQKVMRLLNDYADVLEQSSIDEAYLDCSQKILQYQHSDKKSTSEENILNETKIIENKKNNENFKRFDTDYDSYIKDYALKIKDSIKEECSGLVCSIGVAHNKSIAKIASDFQKPDGLTIIYPQNSQEFLSGLSVDKISGIGKKTTKRLKEMGIHSIGQLSNSSVQKLIEIFGKKHGLWMWYVANGTENDPVMTRADNISLSTEETLLSPTLDKQKILHLLCDDMADDLYQRVRRKGYEFKTVGLKLVRNNFSVETREITFSSYQNRKESIVSVIGLLLEKFNLDGNEYDIDDGEINKPTIRHVRKLGLRVSGLVRIDDKIKYHQQKSLLDFI